MIYQNQQYPPVEQDSEVYNPHSFGLGDLIADLASLFGIQPCKPCKRRQEKLNNWISW